MNASRPRRRKDPAFWNSLNRILVALIVLAFLAALILWFAPELTRRRDMAQALQKKRAKLAAQELLLKKREREVYLLQHDTFYIETIARDKLDLMKDGETIFRLEASPSPRPRTKNE